jgi:hypothetical protein
MNYLPFARLVILFAALGGCARSADFPSLAKRPFERDLAPVAEPALPPVQSDAALLGRVAKAVAQARAGQADFDAALATARSAVAAAGASAAASDAWIAAQLQISRAERTVDPVQDALSELTSDQMALILNAPGSPDRSAIDAAMAEVEQIANTQSAALAALKARLDR